MSVDKNEEAGVAKVEKSVVRQQPNRISRFFNETMAELRKVNWPTRQEAQNLTKIVIVVIIAMATFLGVLDFIFLKLFAIILS